MPRGVTLSIGTSGLSAHCVRENQSSTGARTIDGGSSSTDTGDADTRPLMNEGGGASIQYC